EPLVDRRSAAKIADNPHRRLLPARRERPCCCCAADKPDERAPPDHSITSSARARSVGGTSRPRAFAVLRLITSSYLIGACTGRSVGFAPLSMRSMYSAALAYWSNTSLPYEISPPSVAKYRY